MSSPTTSSASASSNSSTKWQEPAHWQPPAHPSWLTDLSKSHEKAVNRPWADPENRKAAGCVAHDFVKYQPRVLLEFYWNEQSKTLEGGVLFTMYAEGPPKGAHGASIALVYDEILAYPVWRTDHTAFTAALTVNYRRMTPLNTWHRFTAQIKRIEGRKIYLEGKITSGDGSVLYSDGNGMWLDTPQLSSIAAERRKHTQLQKQAKL